MSIGFYLAAVVISLIWIYDWRHYIRYWIRSRPPYSRRIIIIIRGFFWACFLGSGFQLTFTLLHNHLSLENIFYSVLQGVLIIIIFLLFDGVFRMYLGPPR